MGSLHQGPPSPPPLLQDLKVTLLNSSMVYPPHPNERRSMFLTNIDQVLNFKVDSVHLFPANPEFPFDTIVSKLRASLQELLVPYDFMAGRLVLNPQEARLEVDCNGAGAAFIVASSDLSLADMGDFDCHNSAFRQLVAGKPGSDEDQPLCVLQVTSFKCGGFAMGVSNNHCLIDGASYRMFLENLASLAAGGPLSFPPCNDRHLLGARSPPCITFPHPELVKVDCTPPLSLDEPQPPSEVMDTSSENIEFRYFHLTTDDIAALKEKAKLGGADATAATGFNVVTAHLWRCKALATNKATPDAKSTVLYAVDIRPRLRPPLPPTYTGNAILTAYGTATYGELEEGPFSHLIELVREGVSRMTDEYARSVIDWGQVHKGFPSGEVCISSWWRLGFDDVEFPWGKASYSCPVAHPRKDIIVLFPASGGGSMKKGLNAMVALPGHDTDKFETLFYEYLC